MAAETTHTNELFAVGNTQLNLYECTLTIYMLNNGLRVFLIADVELYLNSLSKQTDAGATKTELHQHIEVIKKYLPSSFVKQQANNPILFKLQHAIVNGIQVEDVEVLFKAFSKARHQGKLSSRYVKIGGLAEQYFFFTKK